MSDIQNKKLVCDKCGKRIKRDFKYCPFCAYTLKQQKKSAHGDNVTDKEDIMIEAIDLTKTYLMGKSAVIALRGVDIKVKEGEIVSIMGPSGSGKSTLLHLLGGLDVPTKGIVYLKKPEGGLVDISVLSNNQLANIRLSLTGFIFQQFYLLPSLSARENIAIPLVFANHDQTFIQQRTQELLELVKLNERGDHLPSELSGGEQQRVAIARAIANNPQIVFADEPTGDLDTKSGHMVLSILKELNKLGKTVVMVSHDPKSSEYAEKVYFLQDGKFVDKI